MAWSRSVFVLSGFLITDILLRTRDTSNYFKNFYVRRVLRIFPLYYLSLLLFLVIIPAIAPRSLDVQYYQEHQSWFWMYLQNWLLILHPDGNAVALNHFWSLAVEEQFYLVWPFVILLVRKPNLSSVALLVCIAGSHRCKVVYLVQPESYPIYQWLFLFTRIDGILIGSMLAVVYQHNQSAIRRYSTALILLLAGLNFLVYFIEKDRNFPVWPIGGYTTFAVMFALLVYESIRKENRLIQLIFNNPVLRFLGKYSYGFYIFHWPVFLLLKPLTDSLTNKWLTQGSTSQLGVSAILATLGGLIISVISYHIFEKHFLKLNTSCSCLSKM